MIAVRFKQPKAGEVKHALRCTSSEDQEAIKRERRSLSLQSSPHP